MPAAEEGAPNPAAGAGYDTDFYIWTIEQASALREGRLAELDTAHLAEEIEDLGKAVFAKLRSSFRIILLSMLKWDHQPERRSRAWAGAIDVERLEVADILADSPSLHLRQDDATKQAYRWARVRAAAEMNRSERTLPVDCPYRPDDILDRPFEWPDR